MLFLFLGHVPHVVTYVYTVWLLGIVVLAHAGKGLRCGELLLVDL
jgi:hypothetical protein